MKWINQVSTVFWVSLVLCSIFIAWGAFLPNNVDFVLGLIDSFLSTNFGWFYLLATTLFVVFAIFLVFGPYSKIRLGKNTEKPEYGFFTWFAFLFTAGMGVGLIFYAIAEPVSHWHAPPTAEPKSPQAAQESIKYSIFHWGLHPWATYATLALALAYFKFRHRAPALISTVFTPILGDRARGPIGHSIDVLAVFATVFGIATSLGLGASQISAGLSYSFEGINNNLATQLIVIGIVTLIFMASALSGIDKGIRWLSWGNVLLAVALMVFVFFVGSRLQMVETALTVVGSYFRDLPVMTLEMYPFNGNRDFLNNWTLFYWAWWIGWAPFVATFIARVSKGRTIREFVIGVTLVPLLFSVVWFSIFGFAGIEADGAQGGQLHQIVQNLGEEYALFAFFETQPWSAFIIGVAVILVASFFITSADAATFSISMLTTGGRLNPSSTVKIIWGVVLAGTASVLLLSGGLEAIQKAMLIAAFPFGILMIVLAFSLFKALKTEKRILTDEKLLAREDLNIEEKSRSLNISKKKFAKIVAKDTEPEKTDK